MTTRIMNMSIWEMSLLGVDFYHLISWFIIFSVLGWVWETTYVSIKNHEFVNRGFVTGPVCTIYGMGAVCVYMALKSFANNFFIIFFMGMLVATVLEYITSFLMEKVFHAKWWDYSSKKWNVNGRICLGASVGWGFFSLALFWLLMPFVNWITNLYPQTVGQVGILVAGVLYVIDFVFSAAGALDLAEKLSEMEHIFGEVGEKLKASKFFEELDNARGELEKQKEILSKFQVRATLEEAGKNFIARQSHASKRILRAYPAIRKNVPKPAELQEFLEKFKDILKKKFDDK